MNITSIKQQVRDQNRVSVSVDQKYSFSLTLDELVREKLKIGLELDPSRLKKLKQVSLDGKIRSRALDWALNRPRSVKEFGNYLMKKKVDKLLVAKLTEEFIARDYLSDEVYASWLIDVRSRAGKSNKFISSQLLANGISRDIFEPLLSDLDQPEGLRLQSVVDKKQKLSRYKSNPDKLIRYLLGQGFRYSDIQDSLKRSGIDS